jgi:methyltransferase family protein
VRVVPAGDFNYELRGGGYSLIRRPEPRFALKIRDALGDSTSLINVGAGTGSYEPSDMSVTPIEPSETMRAQRPPHLAPAIDAVAEELPFPDKTFDAALASVTVHQWSDLRRGLSELRRVTRGPIVIMTFDPVSLRKFWLAEYAPEMMERESGRMPDLAELVELLAENVRIQELSIPADCADGFAEAYFGRPESFLDAEVRQSQSSWGFVNDHEEHRSVERLRDALEDGSWDSRFGALRTASEYSGALRLLVANPE